MQGGQCRGYRHPGPVTIYYSPLRNTTGSRRSTSCYRFPGGRCWATTSRTPATPWMNTTSSYSQSHRTISHDTRGTCSRRSARMLDSRRSSILPTCCGYVPRARPPKSAPTLPSITSTTSTAPFSSMSRRRVQVLLATSTGTGRPWCLVAPRVQAMRQSGNCMPPSGPSHAVLPAACNGAIWAAGAFRAAPVLPCQKEGIRPQGTHRLPVCRLRWLLTPRISVGFRRDVARAAHRIKNVALDV